jgi:hypothetical protein
MSGANKNREADVVRSLESDSPSQVKDVPFICAKYKGKMPADIGRVGKWLFFVTEKYVDDTWRNVKKAVEDGKLWKVAKVSTARSSNGGSYVVCVYTYDCDDEKDVMKIREHLRKMGFKRPASYKTDEQTLAGIYSDSTEGISKYKA